jgi:hypothetical protein
MRIEAGRWVRLPIDRQFLPGPHRDVAPACQDFSGSSFCFAAQARSSDQEWRKTKDDPAKFPRGPPLFPRVFVHFPRTPRHFAAIATINPMHLA